MYEELVKRLRYCAVSDNQCSECKYHGGSPDGSKMCLDVLMEDAADAIEELTGFVQEAERDRDEYRERLDKEANDFIEELSKPRWIPVTERLPKESERVLVACEDGVSFGFFEEIIADDEFVKEWHDMMYYPISVTHWMPLPEPPKEEE